MHLSYFSKTLILSLVLTSVPAITIGLVLIYEANSLADNSENNLENMGGEVTDILTDALTYEGEEYLTKKLDYTIHRATEFLDERKGDTKLLGNITRTNEDFKNFYLSNEFCTRVSFVNISGYETISIEAGEITSNDANVTSKLYFSGANSSDDTEVYVDYSELRNATTKHVFIYSMKTNDGVVVFEFNLSHLVTLVDSINFRKLQDKPITCYAFRDESKTFFEDFTIVLLTEPVENPDYEIYHTFNFAEKEDLEYFFPGGDVGADDILNIEEVLNGGMTDVIIGESAVGNRTEVLYMIVGSPADYKLTFSLSTFDYVFLAPIDDSTAILNEGLDESVSEMDESQSNMKISSILIIVICISLAVVGAVVSGRRLINRLKELTKAANRINAGDLDFVTKPGGDDEIGELAKAFNGLHEGMKYLTQEVKMAYENKKQ